MAWPPSGQQPKLGSGLRFSRLEAHLAQNPKIRNPGAVAAAIGRKKFGPTKFAALGAAGRK